MIARGSGRSRRMEGGRRETRISRDVYAPHAMASRFQAALVLRKPRMMFATEAGVSQCGLWL